MFGMSQNDVVVDFGEEHAQPRMLSHLLPVVFHLLFRGSALLVYIFAGTLSNSFIIAFLLIIFLLSMDFWTVKNISGRLLVGLRWWNFVDSEGVSHWKYESRKDQSRTNQHEARIFWLALVLTPIVWALLALIALFTFKMSWLIVTIMGISMTGANLFGYVRCKWSNRQEFSSYISKTMLLSYLMKPAPEQNRPAGQT